MKNRIVSSMMTIVLLFCVLPFSAQAAGGLSNFRAVNSYPAGQFTDVPSANWYANFVKSAYEYGLVSGRSATTFEPDSKLKLSEAIKLAACLHSIYNTGEANFAISSPWYQSYVDYALENGIISTGFSNYEANVTRAQFATIFANALPDEALPAINTINDNSVPDVNVNDDYGAAVYKLYRAGIIIGNDATGTFLPNSNIKRSEVSTISIRMANNEFRKPMTLTTGFYAGSYPVPDYGTFLGAQVFDYYKDTDMTIYSYQASDIQVSDYFYGYGDLLRKNGFELVEEFPNASGYQSLYYTNKAYGWDVIFGKSTFDGVEYISVILGPVL